MTENTQPTNQEILTTVQDLSTTVQDLFTTVHGLSATVQDLFTTVHGLSATVQDLSTTVQDLSEAVNEFATHVDKRFGEIDQRFGEIDKRFGEMATKSDLNRLKLDLIDVIDEKNADLKADLTILMRKEDKKVISLIDLLRKKSVIDNTEAAKLLGMDPFPQTYS